MRHVGTSHRLGILTIIPSSCSRNDLPPTPCFELQPLNGQILVGDSMCLINCDENRRYAVSIGRADGINGPWMGALPKDTVYLVIDSAGNYLLSLNEALATSTSFHQQTITVIP